MLKKSYIYNLYTQLLQSSMVLLFGKSSPGSGLVWGTALLRLDFSKCTWSLTYFSYFLFYFNLKYRFCSYMIGMQELENNSIYLTVLLDRKECFSLESEIHNFILFLNWLDFNGILITYYIFEKNDLFEYKSEDTNSFFMEERKFFMEDLSINVHLIFLSRDSFFFMWFLAFFNEFKKKNYFVYDFFENGKVEWYRNLQSWNPEIYLALDDDSVQFKYLTSSDFISNSVTEYYTAKNFYSLKFNFVHLSLCYRFPRNEVHFVQTKMYLDWFIFPQTSLIPVSLFHLFNKMVFFSLKCLFFTISYQHINVCGSIVQHLFLNSFKLLKGLEFVLVFQTENNFKQNELSLYCFVSYYFDVQKLKNLLFCASLDITMFDSWHHNLSSKCTWSYYNRLLAGSYSLDWNIYNTLTETYTKRCIDVDDIYSTGILTRRSNPEMTEKLESYQKGKSVYLVTRYFSGGII